MVSWREVLCTRWADSETWSGDTEVRWLPYGIAPRQFSWVSSWIPGPWSPSSGLQGVSFALLSLSELPACASCLEQRKICMSTCDPWPNHGKNGGWGAMNVLSDSHSQISRALLVVLPTLCDLICVRPCVVHLWIYAYAIPKRAVQWKHWNITTTTVHNLLNMWHTDVVCRLEILFVAFYNFC